MAKTKNALFSTTAKGKVGPLVVENNKKTQYIKTNIKPKDKKTPKQLKKRKLYGQAVAYWKAFTPQEKKEYNVRAKPLKISGFNLFIKEFTTIPKIAIYGIGIYGANNYG